jgi:WD40 repeat protein
MSRPPDGGIYGVTFDTTGRLAAFSTFFSPGPPKQIRIWNLESDTLVQEIPLAPPGEKEEKFDWGVAQLAFTPVGELLAAGEHGIRRFDPSSGESEWIWQLEHGWQAFMGLSQDGRRLLATAMLREESDTKEHPVVLFDLAKGTQKTISSHGNRVVAVALDSAGKIIVTGDEQGVVRVGPADGGEPHLLLGHKDAVNRLVNPLAVSPDGRWIASGAGSEIRLWPMPDLTKPPLHTLPLDQLLSKLHELTNLQVIEDEGSPTGYRLEIGPFPGWETSPEW